MISIGRTSTFPLLSRLSAKNAWTDDASFASRCSRSIVVKWSRASTYCPCRYKATPRSNWVQSGLSVSRSNRGPGSGKTPRISSGGSGSVAGRSCLGADCPSRAAVDVGATATTLLTTRESSAARHRRRGMRSWSCTEGANQQVSCPRTCDQIELSVPQIMKLDMMTGRRCQKLQQAYNKRGQEVDVLWRGAMMARLVLNRVAVTLRIKPFAF